MTDIHKIRAKLRDGVRNIEVNGEIKTLAGDGMWWGVQLRDESDGGYTTRHIQHCLDNGLNCVRLFHWTQPDGLHVRPTAGVKYPVRPDYNSMMFHSTLTMTVEDYLSANIVPIVVLSRAREGADMRTDWAFTSADADHLTSMMEALDGLPCILDMMNETPDAAMGWLKQAVKCIRSVGTQKRPIVINTGYGTGGVSESTLINFCHGNNVHGYSVLDGVSPVPDDLVGIADTDHSGDVLQSTSDVEKVDWLVAQGFRRCNTYLHMRAFEIGFHPTRNSSDPDNPSIPGVTEYLGSITDPIGGGTPVDPPDPPDPPVDPPTPDDPPCDEVLRLLKRAVRLIEDWQ